MVTRWRLCRQLDIFDATKKKKKKKRTPFDIDAALGEGAGAGTAASDSTPAADASNSVSREEAAPAASSALDDGTDPSLMS